MHKIFVFIPLILSLAVTACAPTRDAADKKLANACKGAIKAISPATDEMTFLKNAFSFGKGQEDTKLRVVTLSARVTHNYAITEKTYTCSFKEEWSLFGYRPEFYNLEKDGMKYGNYDGHLLGDLDDMLKISAATEKEY